MSRKKKKPTRAPHRNGGISTHRAKSKTTSAGSTKQGSSAGANSWKAARILWAVVVAIVIAALLFEPTMIYSIAMGIFYLSNLEFIGLWFLVAGYVLACLPAAFGMLIATGQFWRSLTHALWIGLIYALAGFLFLDLIIATF